MTPASEHASRLRAVAKRDGWLDVWGNLGALVDRLNRAAVPTTPELCMAIVDAMEAAYNAGVPRSELRYELVRVQAILLTKVGNGATITDAARAFLTYKEHVCAWRYIGDDTKPREPYGSPPAEPAGATAAERKTRILAEALWSGCPVGAEQYTKPVEFRICVRNTRDGTIGTSAARTRDGAWVVAATELNRVATERVAEIDGLFVERSRIAAALARVAK